MCVCMYKKGKRKTRKSRYINIPNLLLEPLRVNQTASTFMNRWYIQIVDIDVYIMWQ